MQFYPHLNQYQLADALGKGQSTVSETLTLNNLPEDVRSAARTNANIPKSVLLDAAKMKSDLSMRRKFQNYMAKAGKTSQPTDRKQKLSKERALLVKMDELSDKISTLPWGDWSEDDRNELTGALTGIRDRADELLNAMSVPPEGGEAEPPRSGNLAQRGARSPTTKLPSIKHCYSQCAGSCLPARENTLRSRSCQNDYRKYLLRARFVVDTHICLFTTRTEQAWWLKKEIWRLFGPGRTGYSRLFKK